ncbi:hypothetical protein AVEN_82182-1 [Araneus ventricosus]|uniref:Uncharacterized protein n=1 Tax=Araneus ventricosus TaxID=182803 RepID=A0A4Y2TS74_ARAVE|nr:hypothetical protein AVEN_82182-1 [Araneus ventricosus]
MQEFLKHQSVRKLRGNDSSLDYIYSNDALLEKAPFTMSQSDGISMIIFDITEEKWKIALATQNSTTLEELIDRATAHDSILTFPKIDSQSFHVPEERSEPKYNENVFLEVPNYEKRKIDQPANNVKPLNKKDKVKIAKLDRCEIRENRTKEKPMLGTLKGYETRREDHLPLLTAEGAESVNNVCESNLANKRGFKFPRRLHSFEAPQLRIRSAFYLKRLSDGHYFSLHIKRF